jgi:hypothetical protein
MSLVRASGGLKVTFSKIQKHLEFGHVNNVDHLNASPRTFYVTCGYTLEYHVKI